MHVLAFALAAAALAPPHGAKDVHTLDVRDARRAYELFVPPTASSHAPSTAGHPLVVLLHGRGGSARQVRTNTGFDDVARAHEFVVAYPDGLDGAWRDLRQSTLVPDRPFEDDDVAFLLALVDTLVRDRGVDPARVAFVGHSNGAMMALTLACLHPERVAAVVAVAGNLPTAACALARPVPALFFFGTHDALVPFEGGGVGVLGGRGTVRSARDTVAAFARAAGCTTTERTPIPLDERAARRGMSAVQEHHLGCAVPVEAVIVQGGGHGWPGHGPIWRRNPTSLDASALIGAFFAGLPPGVPRALARPDRAR